jgi:hypothetical protein
MDSKWKVTKHYQLNNTLVIHLEAEGMNPAKVIWNGTSRRYEYDGWGLLLDRQYHAGIDQALKEKFQ